MLSRVSPFGYPRLDGCMRLPAAFRSFLRPSSAPGAKAFSLCSSSLVLLLNVLFVCSYFNSESSRCPPIPRHINRLIFQHTFRQPLIPLLGFLSFSVFSFQGAILPSWVSRSVALALFHSLAGLTRVCVPSCFTEVSAPGACLDGDKETRTLDPLLAGQVLSQLSYAPGLLVLPPTFPLPFPASFRSAFASAFTVPGSAFRHSFRSPNLLLPIRVWAQVDSNHRPRAYQARALTG